MKKHFILPSLIMLGFFCGVIGNPTETTKVDASATSPVVDADVSRFYIQNPHPTSPYVFTPDVTNGKIAYQGTWDSSFCSTDQFNTLSNKYTFSVHVKSEEVVTGGNFGLSLFKYTSYEKEDFLDFYLSFNDKNTIGSFSLLAHTQGSLLFRAAREGDSEFTNCNTWYTAWGDNSANFANGALPSAYTINPQTGFDITFTVEKTIVFGVEVEAFSWSMNTFLADGITPATYASKVFYIEWGSKVVGDTVREAMKPVIGFMNDATPTLTLSNIKFQDLSTYAPKSELSIFGTTLPGTAIDYTNKKVTINSSEVCRSGVALSTLNNTSNTFMVSADISGVGANEGDVVVGFSVRYSATTIANYFLEWDPRWAFPMKFTSHFLVNDVDSGVCNYAKNPWDSALAEAGVWHGYWLDYGGTRTNVYGAADGCFNNYFSEVATTVTVTSGFKLSLINNRVTRFGKLVDEVTLVITAPNKQGVLTNWYTPVTDFDAFTSDALASKVPEVCFYAAHGTTNSYVTFSNIQFNSKNVEFQKSADQWADAFLNGIGCDPTGVTPPATANWTASQTLYGELSDTAKLTLKNATASETGTNIEKAVALYDYIQTKYGSTTYANFLQRSVNTVSSGLTILDNISNNSTTLIVIISLITLAAATTLIVLRKKER